MPHHRFAHIIDQRHPTNRLRKHEARPTGHCFFVAPEQRHQRIRLNVFGQRDRQTLRLESREQGGTHIGRRYPVDLAEYTPQRPCR